MEARKSSKQRKKLPINQVLVGDCIEVMNTFPPESIDMVMFSPPYWGLRDYHVEGQFGLEDTWQEYVEHMRQVGRAIWRILKKEGNLYIVLGDTFMKKHKLGLPWRVRFALNEDGWISRGDIIWHKPNAMPSSVKDRLNTTYEVILHLVKQRKYYYDLDAIREPHKTKYQPFNIRVRDAQKGRLSAKWGDSASQSEIEQYDEKLYKYIREISELAKQYDNPGYSGKSNEKTSKAWTSLHKNLRAFRIATKEVIKKHKLKGEIAKQLLEYAQNHFSHPLGKNPGDVIKENQSQSRSKSSKLSKEEQEKLGSPHAHTKRNSDIYAKDYHIKGKNPGDVIKIMEELNKRFRRRGSKHQIVPGDDHPIRTIYPSVKEILSGKRGINHPLGKNPGDVIIGKDGEPRILLKRPKDPDKIYKVGEDEKYSKAPPHRGGHAWGKGYGKHSFMTINPKGKNPGDVIKTKAEMLRESTEGTANITHGHYKINGKLVYLGLRNHPLGKNPGDVFRNKTRDESFKGRLAMRQAPEPNEPNAFHPLGKNPGDIIEKNPVRHKPWLRPKPDKTRSWMSNPGHPFTHKYTGKPQNPGDFWSINTRPFKGAHFAVYPEEICIKPIKSSCPPGGIVLDPMCGSGTTLVVAKKLGRKYIGIDLNPDYVEIARKRLREVSKSSGSKKKR